MSEKMVWWNTGSTYNTEDITSKEFVGETPEFLLFVEKWNGKPKQRRVAKKSHFEHWHRTWQEARDFLLDRTRKKLEDARHRVNRLVHDVEKLKLLQKPDER